MAPYSLLYISRSDGKIETISKLKKKEANGPTEAQLDDTKDARGVRDYYKRLEIGDAKEVDWRRKLGGMLMREIGDKEHLGRTNLTSFRSFLWRLMISTYQVKTTSSLLYQKTIDCMSM